MRGLADRLASMRLTLVLLVSLVAVFLIGLAVPQKSVLQRELYDAWRAESPTTVALLEALRLTDVYRSPLAYGVWAAFFLNLAVVMARRVPGTLRRTRIGGEIPDPAAPGFAIRRTLPLSAGRMAEVRAFFEARGHSVYASGDRLRAVKNRFAPLATLGFHLSFFVIAAGSTASFVTRFEGEVELGQGETFTGAPGQYAGTPKLPVLGTRPATTFVVEAIEPEFAGNVATGVRVRIRDERGLLRTLEINRPYEGGGASFVFRNLGVAPLLVVTDAEGTQHFAGFLRLNVLQGRSDAFTLLGQRFVAELFPDYVADAGGERTRSQEMRDPVLRLTLETVSGRKLTGSIRPGEALPLGPYLLTFADWRYWVKLYVRSERGLWLLWIGFALGLGALALRLLRYRREYVAVWADGPGGPALVVAARAEFYRDLFAEEAERTFDALEAALAGPGSSLVDSRP